MSYKFLKLLLFILISTVAAGYVFYLNPTSVSFKYNNTPEAVIEKPLAFILLCAFIVGIVLTTILAFWVFLKYKFHIWRLHKAAEEISSANIQISKAREYLALKEISAARDLLQKVIDRDAKNITAQIMLAKTYHLENKPALAIKVIDEARVANEKNKELLLYAAELNEELGNFTAAIDNLAIAHESDNKAKIVLAKLINYCQRINKHEQALEYGHKLVKLADNYDEQQLFLEQLAQLELDLIKSKSANNPQQQKIAINDLLKRHRNFTPAIFELGIIEKNNFNIEAALNNLNKAFSLKPEIKYLEEIAFILLGINDPDRAIATSTNAINNLEKIHGKNADIFIEAKIFFICLLLSIEFVEKAKIEFSTLSNLEVRSKELRDKINLLNSVILSKQGETIKANQILNMLSQENIKLPFLKNTINSEANVHSDFLNWSKKAKEINISRNQPSPEIITNQ